MSIMHMLLNLCQQNFLAPNIHKGKFKRGEIMIGVKSLKVQMHLFETYGLDDSSVFTGSISGP